MITYETAYQMVERLGVTPRTVQIWAKEGKLPGAIKHGRDWIIPSGLAKPDKTGYTQYIEKMPLPLFKGSFKPGEAHDFVASLPGDDMKRLAQTEFLYVTGNPEDEAVASEDFFNHHDIIIRLSACMVYAFFHFSTGHTNLAEIGLSTIKESIIREITSAPTPLFKAVYTIIYATVSVLMSKTNYKDKLLEYIKYLPMGLQLWTGYILAHKAFIERDFTEGVTTAQIFLSMQCAIYDTNLTAGVHNDDILIASLTVNPGDSVDVTDFSNWTFETGVSDYQTIDLGTNNSAEKMYVLACRLNNKEIDNTLYPPVDPYRTLLKHSILDVEVVNDQVHIVGGFMDDGGELTVPDANITRAEFAAICARFDESEYEAVDTFTDISGHWAEVDIHEAAAHGWIKGYEDNTFKPNQFITRAEAMTMINRVLNRLPETEEDLLDTMIKWPDNSDVSSWYYLPVQEATNSHFYEFKNNINEKWTSLGTVEDWARFN